MSRMSTLKSTALINDSRGSPVILLGLACSDPESALSAHNHIITF